MESVLSLMRKSWNQVVYYKYKENTTDTVTFDVCNGETEVYTETPEHAEALIKIFQ